MPFDPPPPPHPTTAGILDNDLIAEFLADVRPSMSRAQVGEKARYWLAYIDCEYAEAGITLTEADLTAAMCAMTDAAYVWFDAKAQSHADAVRAGVVDADGNDQTRREYSRYEAV